ncbi:MAG TPA: phosphoribosylanthranilate isomerase [Alphaproteobacteria bacterium]|nr:phosphoribosylanthranilate isomerase [Alphaproteobacteria bacterium]
MSPWIKICGVNDAAAINAAAASGATHIGFVFDARSARYVPPGKARDLAAITPTTLRTVGLIVDARDPEIDAIMLTFTPHLWQLHGSESPERAADIRARTGRPVAKAFGIGNASDVKAASAFDAVVDVLLFDAKPPASDPSLPPGGHGQAFDWAHVRDLHLQRPWFLAGGLRPDSVAEAIRIARPHGVDVSSGVEQTPGQKDPDLIRAFCANARDAFAKLDR